MPLADVERVLMKSSAIGALVVYGAIATTMLLVAGNVLPLTSPPPAQYAQVPFSTEADFNPSAPEIAVEVEPRNTIKNSNKRKEKSSSPHARRTFHSSTIRTEQNATPKRRLRTDATQSQRTQIIAVNAGPVVSAIKSMSNVRPAAQQVVLDKTTKRTKLQEAITYRSRNGEPAAIIYRPNSVKSDERTGGTIETSTVTRDPRTGAVTYRPKDFTSNTRSEPAIRRTKQRGC